METEGDFAWGGGCTMPCADGVLLSRAVETYMVLWTSATPMNSTVHLLIQAKGILNDIVAIGIYNYFKGIFNIIIIYCLINFMS